MTQHYYLLTALPRLGELGSPPPLTPAELREWSRDGLARELVEALLLGDDLVQREAYLAGTLDAPDPVILSTAQVRGEASLPVDPSDDAHDDCDAVQAAYLRFVAALARKHPSPLLERWVGAEVALRNGLVRARARAIGLDAAGRDVAPELALPDAELDAAVSSWTAAPDPIAGFELLLRARWSWIERAETPFSFEDDELVAYVLRFLLLRRWHRIAQPPAVRA